MRKPNPDHTRELLKLIHCGPYFRLLSIDVTDVGVGTSRVELELQDKHINVFGGIHGGVYSSVIDTAAYWAVYYELDEGVGYTSIDLTVNNLAMIREGKIFVEGKSLKVGRSICLSEATARDSSGRLLAYGTSKLMVLREKQSIAHAIQTWDRPPLPPKFIDYSELT